MLVASFIGWVLGAWLMALVIEKWRRPNVATVTLDSVTPPSPSPIHTGVDGLTGCLALGLDPKDVMRVVRVTSEGFAVLPTPTPTVHALSPDDLRAIRLEVQGVMDRNQPRPSPAFSRHH